MEKYLIINADDFGVSHSHNVAVMEMLLKGNVTSSTVMMPCSWAKEACVFAHEHPELAIGVHLTTTCEWSKYRWAPVNTEGSASLRDEEGFMWYESDEFEKHAKLEEVVYEINAQLNRAAALGLTPSHVDNHMGSLYGVQTGRFDMLPALFEIAGRAGLPFRFPKKITAEMFKNDTLDINIEPQVVENAIGQLLTFAESQRVAMPDHLLPHDFNGPQRDSYESFSDYMHEFLAAIPDGITETYLHPAVETDELKAITGNWKFRTWEYRFYSDEKTHRYIRDLGIRKINYRDLKKMRGF